MPARVAGAAPDGDLPAEAQLAGVDLGDDNRDTPAPSLEHVADRATTAETLAEAAAHRQVALRHERGETQLLGEGRDDLLAIVDILESVRVLQIRLVYGRQLRLGRAGATTSL